MEAKLEDKQKLEAFPATAVEAMLRDELAMVAEVEAPVQGIELPKSRPALMKASIRLDSLTVVDVICAVEPIIGFELHEAVVQTGGYKSIDAAIEHLMPRIERAWKKHHGVKA